VTTHREPTVSNLPATVTSFVGRDQEIAALRDLLTHQVRLLTLARQYVTAAFEQASIAPEAGLSLYLRYVAAVAEAEGNLDEAERTYQLALEQTPRPTWRDPPWSPVSRKPKHPNSEACSVCG
jgi:hypothetical protein